MMSRQRRCKKFQIYLRVIQVTYPNLYNFNISERIDTVEERQPTGTPEVPATSTIRGGLERLRYPS